MKKYCCKNAGSIGFTGAVAAYGRDFEGVKIFADKIGSELSEAMLMTG